MTFVFAERFKAVGDDRRNTAGTWSGRYRSLSFGDSTGSFAGGKLGVMAPI
jgi:hypothetical protein